MKIRKTYVEVSPEFLYAEIRDFTLKQGLELIDSRMETFTLPDESTSFVSRGTLVFALKNDSAKECLRVHIVGSGRETTKLMMDIDEAVFPADKLTALQEDIDFIFSQYEPEE
jgi:hypothetical protein